MIDRQELLSDLQRLLRQLEADLRDRCKVEEIAAAVKAEYENAKKHKRTALSFEAWRADYITQIGAAWILSCVFARFLEDNELVDPPKLSGPGDRLQRARDEYDLWVHEHPADTVREYLLSVFDGLAELPGGKDIFGKHNLVHEQRGWISGDAAKELRNFWQQINPATGRLIHDFTDPKWDTRFLGDLYQDLSEAAQKKYALLQTPEFVEEFILDRTLEPALDEFGVDAPAIKAHYDQPATPAGFRMIDPACGSGHFLLGAFHHILDRWQTKEPGTKVRELVLRTLKSVNGVDLNPFAVAISRFRLLLAAMQACGFRRLKGSVAFEIRVACGDALLHGPDTAVQKKLVDDGDRQHAYWVEDLPLLRQILRNKYYHCVVANPPYITPKDKAANQSYRRLYSSCHMKYSLAVPFMERIFRLAIRKTEPNETAGHTGQITANTFMKREFGKKLIEEFFPTVELTHVIDTAGAYIPGHGTPTVIVFGRNQAPVREHVRCVMGIEGEPSTPSNPADGQVWTAIVEQVDIVDSESAFVSVTDTNRTYFYRHPWSIGGGGAAELKQSIDDAGQRSLGQIADAIGFFGITGEEQVYVFASPNDLRRLGIDASMIRWFVIGEDVRDWKLGASSFCLFPYDEDVIFSPHPSVNPHLWRYATLLKATLYFGKTKAERGMDWREYVILMADRLRSPNSITFADVATHNHFVFDTGGKMFNSTAPVIKLRSDAHSSEHIQLTAALNSSTACFWMKQVCQNKGSTVDQHGARQRTSPFEDFYAFSGSKLKKLPLPAEMSERIARSLHDASSDLSQTIPSGDNLNVLANSGENQRRILGEMIRLQEDLDWEHYRLYSLLNEDLTYRTEAFGIQLGQRAFEIVLARKMARGEVQTTWFERHGSTPITEVPADWPEDYRELVERRIEAIESNPQIALIEQPEYKRRWNTESWDSQVERALRSWLLDRLESHFDFDGRMNDERCATVHASLTESCLISTAQLADIARADREFMEVAAALRSRTDFDVARLVTELVVGESVPLLPILRYKPAAMDKRLAWERTWQMQRVEDHIQAELVEAFTRNETAPAPHDTIDIAEADGIPIARDVFFNPETKAPLFQQLSFEELVKRAKQVHVGEIPVPPKYKSSDFQSSTYWRLRGKLDVPKERWISFPHCEGEDQSLVIAWAGYDHLQLAKAISAYFAEVQEKGGSEDPRLVPLLGCILELVPWLKQWYNEVDAEFGYRLGGYFEGFVEDEARTLGMTVSDVRDWQPPKTTNRRGRRTT